jgi:predicted nucleic acid-binding Zn ribbon protein
MRAWRRGEAVFDCNRVAGAAYSPPLVGGSPVPEYGYRCPGCGAEFTLHLRATLHARQCPHCGEPIRPSEIDRQQEGYEQRQEDDRRVERRKRNTALIVALILAVLCVVLSGGCCLLLMSVPARRDGTADNEAKPAADSQPDDAPVRQRGGFGRGGRGGSGGG